MPSGSLFDFVMERIKVIGETLDAESTKALAQYKGKRKFTRDMWMTQLQFCDLMRNIRVACNVWELLSEPPLNGESWWRLGFDGELENKFSIHCIR